MPTRRPVVGPGAQKGDARMPVYLDTPRTYPAEPEGYKGHPRSRAVWCHMIADTPEELHDMARRLSLRLEWFQAGHGGHYDLTPSKRTAALRLGAVALSARNFVAKLKETM